MSIVPRSHPTDPHIPYKDWSITLTTNTTTVSSNMGVQVVANMLSSPLTGNPAKWVAFSFNPEAVREARGQGLPVLFGDGSKSSVLGAATSASPRAFVLSLRSHPQTMQALRNVRQAWPTVPVFVLCIDVERAAEAQRLGATATVRPPPPSLRSASAFGICLRCLSLVSASHSMGPAGAPRSWHSRRTDSAVVTTSHQ